MLRLYTWMVGQPGKGGCSKPSTQTWMALFWAPPVRSVHPAASRMIMRELLRLQTLDGKVGEHPPGACSGDVQYTPHIADCYPGCVTS